MHKKRAENSLKYTIKLSRFFAQNENKPKIRCFGRLNNCSGIKLNVNHGIFDTKSN